MLQFINQKMNLEMGFIILFIITIYYAYSKRFGERNLGLIISSFFQGIILSVIFPEYLLFAPILALTYYIFFNYLWNIIFALKSFSRKLEDYSDSELIRALKEISELKNLKFDLRKYSGTNSLNANVLPPIPFISNRYQISLGEELISKFTMGEKKFVLAHEVGHILRKHIQIKLFLFFLLLWVLIFVSLGLNLLVLNKAKEYFVQFDYLITISLFIIGIIGLNLISWYTEYDADKKALQLIKDTKSLETSLIKLGEGHHNKDYGKIINLIVYSHPLIKNRIKRGKELQKPL